MNKIRIGLIGAGHLGKIHLRLLKESPEYELIGFYDSDHATAEAVEKESGIPAMASAAELISRSDAVDIVTPTPSHHQLARTALLEKKHVFIEKPIAQTVKEAADLVGLVRASGVQLQVGHVERFNPAFISVQNKIGAPMFIETHRLAQFNPRGTDVSVVLDLMIHDIDIALSLIPSPVKEVYASGVSIISDSPDISNARIEFENGAVANLTASRISMKNMRKSRFFQPGAYISVDFLEKKSELIQVRSIDKEPDDPFAITVELPGKGMKQIIFENQPAAEGNAIRSELSAFAASIRKQAPVPVTAEDGYRALEIAYRIMDRMKIAGNS